MRGLVVSALVLVILASLSFIVASSKNTNDLKNAIQKFEELNLDFGTFTSAVCENKEDAVACKDEVFVKCNGNVTKAVDGAECSGFKIDVPKATGFAIFGSNWKDPRN